MIDNIIYCMSEALRHEGFILPFGTVYRVAEVLEAMLEGESSELVSCCNCQSHEPCEVRNRVWCRKMGRYMKEDGFCSEGKVIEDG